MVGQVSHKLLSQGETVSWSRRRLTECNRCTEQRPHPRLGLSAAGQNESPVALGTLKQWMELSGAEQEAGAARREEKSHGHMGSAGKLQRAYASIWAHVCA